MDTRIAILATHPIQYNTPLYAELARTGTLSPHVIYLTDGGAGEYYDPGFARRVAWDLPLLAGYDYQILEPGLELSSTSFWSRSRPGLLAALTSVRPHALLLYGYASLMNWQALRWARRNGCKILYASDSNIDDPRPRHTEWLRQRILRWYFARVDIFLTTSDKNGKYLTHYGAATDRLQRFPFCIDVSRFARGADPPGSRRPIDFVWVGKLIKLKRPLDFIRALRRCVELTGAPVSGLIIGDGPLRAQVADAIQHLPPLCTVSCTGFINQTELPAKLQTGSVLVMTSDREAYGLAAAEGAAAGLALLLADRIGCIGEHSIARPGANVVTFQAGDVAALAKSMVMLMQDRDQLNSMQRQSRKVSAEHDVAVAARIIESLVLRRN